MDNPGHYDEYPELTRADEDAERVRRAKDNAMTNRDEVPRNDLPPLPAPYEIDWPELHSQALGCGLEDRGLRDRYECAEYGWQEGVDRAADRVPEEIFTADQMREYAREAVAAALAPTAEQADAVRVSDAARDVLAERQRQMSVEGWTPEHDDEHDMGEMAHAAAWYSIDQMMRNALDERGLSFWPWAQEWWKPSTPRRDLVKAGALILAEIERIDRAEPGTCFFCSQPMSGTHESDCPQAPASSTEDQA